MESLGGWVVAARRDVCARTRPGAKRCTVIAHVEQGVSLPLWKSLLAHMARKSLRGICLRGFSRP